MTTAVLFAIFLLLGVLPYTVGVEDARREPFIGYSSPLYPYDYIGFGLTFNDNNEGANDGNIYTRRDAPHPEVWERADLDGG